ncbi:MAG: hypothetical protein AVDCRST_MAG35-2269 [uncultured Quadrisphaera sp.]|uniref:Uncharacterized protein n=1 Tax=uncultured Quadrisphaera sp. TaxID=904978 RepID=A0A6J4PV13_9ACTN|nr:MAG: hypothetical protein AVDCRST_MAG35-2269 [uncultured Quadrisphaera sp.]
MDPVVVVWITRCGPAPVTRTVLIVVSSWCSGRGRRAPLRPDTTSQPGTAAGAQAQPGLRWT